MLPIAHTIAIRYLAFVVLIVLTVTVLFEERKVPVVPFASYWLAYFLVALVSVFFAADPEMSLSELRVEVIYCIVIFVIGITWGGRYQHFERFVVLLTAINLILTTAAFSVVSQNMLFTEILKVHPVAFAGMDGNLLLVMVPLNSWLACRFWNSGRKMLSIMLAGLIVLDVWALMATQNRQNLVSLGAGITAASILLLWIRFSWRRAALFIGVLSVVMTLLVAQLVRRGGEQIQAPAVASSVAASLERAENVTRVAATTDVRWGLWKFSLEKIAEHPWIGGGFGRGVFDRLYPEYLPENAQLWHAHNMILNKGIQMGIPGMMAFVALWIALATEVLRHTRTQAVSRYLATAGFAALVAIFTKNMTDDFFVRNVALWFWLIMGLLIGFLRADAARVKTRHQ